MFDAGGKTPPEGVFDESNRRPTNRLWLFPFVIAVIAFIAVAVLAGCSAGFKGLANHHKNDTNGPTCGFDSNVLDNPYMLYVDERDCMMKNKSLTDCSEPWICLKSCPRGVFDSSSCTTENFPVLKEKLACQNTVVRDSVTNCETMANAVKLRQCAGWFNGTDYSFGYCHSRGVKDSSEEDPGYLEFKENIGEFFRKVSPSFLLAIVIAIAVSFFFIITLKWSAAFVFWGFVVVVMLILVIIIIIIGVVLGSAAETAKDKEAAEQAKTGLYIYLAIMIIFFFIFILCLYFFRRKIRCGIEIVKESSRAVTCSYSSVFFPLLPFIIRAIVVLTLIFSVIMAMLIRSNYYTVHGSLAFSNCTCNNSGYIEGGACLPTQFNKDCHTATGGICEVALCKLDEQADSSVTTIYIIVLIFTGMWIVAFVQANTKMILAHIYGNWYWNYNQEFIPSGAVCTAMGKILGNHTGTAAFGSLIITLCRILKSLLSRRDREGEAGIGAVILRIIGECIRACAQVLLDIIEFVSDKAFVCCAIMGTDFWESVKGVSKIMVKDLPLVVATEYVGSIILFVCKFVAAIVSAGLFYCIAPFKDDEKWITIVFAIIIFIFAYDLAGILLTAYDVAIDTLLICGLQDYMNNKTEKAYFKSETLNELLLKKDTA